MPARAANFLGFGKKPKPRATKRSEMTVSAAMAAAYRAGKQSGDTGLFQQWLSGAGLADRGGLLRTKLRMEYERGFEAGHEESRQSTAGMARAFGGETTRRTVEAQRVIIHSPSSYKGHRIQQVEDHWESSIDPGTWFDSERDVKKFIDKNPRGNPDLHSKLAHAVTDYDRKQEGKRGYNRYALSQYLRAVHETVADIDLGKAPRRALVDHFSGRLLDATLKAAGLPSSTRDEQRNPKRNPEDAAADKFEEFHGSPSESVQVVEREIHYHEHLAQLGDLCQIKVRTVTGLDACLSFAGYVDDPVNDFSEDVPVADRPQLSCSEDGRQLYVIGGDQCIGLDALEMDTDEWLKDKMVLGEAYEVTYQTRKGFDKFKTTSYFHELGEESGVPVTLVYDTLNDQLEFVGGQYQIKPEPEGGGGSVYN